LRGQGGQELYSRSNCAVGRPSGGGSPGRLYRSQEPKRPGFRPFGQCRRPGACHSPRCLEGLVEEAEPKITGVAETALCAPNGLGVKVWGLWLFAWLACGRAAARMRPSRKPSNAVWTI